MIDKQVRSVAEALDGVKDGATVMLSGFAGVGEPRILMRGLIESGVKDLTMVTNTVGRGDSLMQQIIATGRVRKVIVSWARTKPAAAFQKLHAERKIELELVPQGTLALRIQAGGAGVAAFFTPTSVGTPLQAGKEVREFNGKTYVLEHALVGDVGLVEAWQADRWGNLTYRRSGRNFNPLVAMASKLTVVQTQHIVGLGEIDPDHVVTPGIFVQRVLHAPYGDPPP